MVVRSTGSSGEDEKWYESNVNYVFYCIHELEEKRNIKDVS